MTCWFQVAIVSLALSAVARPAMAETTGADDSWRGAYAGLASGLKSGEATWTGRENNGGTVALDGLPARGYDLTALRIGGYGGYNWQRGRWVFGPEADFAWSDKTETRDFFPGCGPGCGGFTAPPGPNDTASVRMKWDGGVRGRIGYLAGPAWLVYGTGGLAIQDMEATGVCWNPTLNSQYCFGTEEQAPITREILMFGYSIGAGVERKIREHWLLRGEYRFSDFPGVDDTMVFPPGTFGNNTYGYRLSAQTHMFTAGLGYKF
ncbi:MAG: outer membrane beta-barrel protein [Elusimicrobia bacterium]|nr:outer membrane beta-barrel protein [Elusimicrobiota bacterium]